MNTTYCLNIQITSVRINRNVKLVTEVYQISLANKGSALECTDVVTSCREGIGESEREKSKQAEIKRGEQNSGEPHPSKGLFED